MEITNADRVVYPDDGLTKGDVVAYYRQAADLLLPHVEGRALTVERYPKGIGGQGFMQKNAPNHYPPDLIARHEVPKEDGGTTRYPVVHSVEGIVFFANLGVITFHVPSTKVGDPMRPDWIVWDLDPPGGDVALVREAARELRTLLEKIGVATMPMTSGSKGYHLRARLAEGADFETATRAARGAAALAVESHPELMTLAFRKTERNGRVFVDWLRNAPYATAVAPWSLRARPGAPVAAPLSWDEIDVIDPDGVRLDNVARRIADDPWSDIAPIDIHPMAEVVDTALKTAGIELEPFDRFRS